MRVVRVSDGIAVIFTILGSSKATRMPLPVTGVNDCGDGRPGVKPGLRAALLDARSVDRVVLGAAPTRSTLDPALGRRNGENAHFTPSGTQWAIWGKVSTAAFGGDAESETWMRRHDSATSAHARLVSNKGARIDEWRSEVSE